MILPRTEFAVPVRGELVVGEPAGAGENQRSRVEHRTIGSGGKPRRARDTGEQEAAAAAPKLGAWHIQQGERNRIDRCRCRSGTVCAIEESVEQRGFVTLCGQYGHVGIIDERPCGRAATLPRALIVHVEKAQLRVPADRPAEVATENVLLDVYLAQEVVVCIECGVAEVFPNIAMEVVGSALE